MAADVRASAGLYDTAGAAKPRATIRNRWFSPSDAASMHSRSRIRVSRHLDRRPPTRGSLRRDHPGDDHQSEYQHDRQAMGFQPASHLAARSARLPRRKAVCESAHPCTDRPEDRAALAQRETKRSAFFPGTHGTNRRNRGEFGAANWERLKLSCRSLDANKELLTGCKWSAAVCSSCTGSEHVSRQQTTLQSPPGTH